MSELIKCPVCGNGKDMPDYHKEDVICPCCGTDLSIYRLLTENQEHSTRVLAESQVHYVQEKANGKKWKIATAASAAVAIASIALLCVPKFQGRNTTLSDDTTFLKDSVSRVLSELDMANKEIADLKEQLSSKVLNNVYIVKRNDSPCKISRKLFGTESRYKEIEAIITKPLQPGDTLYIK